MKNLRNCVWLKRLAANFIDNLLVTEVMTVLGWETRPSCCALLLKMNKISEQMYDCIQQPQQNSVRNTASVFTESTTVCSYSLWWNIWNLCLHKEGVLWRNTFCCHTEWTAQRNSMCSVCVVWSTTLTCACVQVLKRRQCYCHMVSMWNMLGNNHKPHTFVLWNFVFILKM